MIIYSPAQRAMASKAPRKTSSARSSSSRIDPPQIDSKADENEAPKPSPKKTSSFRSDLSKEEKPAAKELAPALHDAFENADNTDDDDNIEITRASVDLDELPIELVQLIDNFVSSLTAKVHSAPPNITRLSSRFQDFYATASSHINTHMSAMVTRQSREASPAPSASSISSAASRLRARTTSGVLNTKEKDAEQQMITAEELTERKRTRKAIEARKALLEEIVERRLCEGIYSRIYRHRSTQDEAQDDKLRSKTAALELVGIGPTDLGIDLGQGDSGALPDDIAEKNREIRNWLEAARKDLVQMHNSRYPLGKVNHLKAAHKSIVDTLAHFHPSASADEIMPMLIYTLITLPPEDLHVISDMHFIENFRWEPKLTGEAAYCLTNLEAAISFLQTVDLATLRADEDPSGPPKQLTADGRAETFPPAYQQGLTEATQSLAGMTNATASASKPAGSPAGLKAATVLRNRRLSDLVNTPAQAFGAASDAVITTADQGIKTISNSLGDSYKFLLGKLREHQQGPSESIIVPRTLDDARKLVSTPPPEDDDLIGTEGLRPMPEQSKRQNSRAEDRVLSLFNGRRDQSVDSNRSNGSSKRFLSAEDVPKVQPSSPGQNPAVLEQMRSLSNSFNPMSRLGNIGPFRGFGRSTPPVPPAKDASKPVADGGDLATAFPDIAAALPPKQTPKIAPPNRRFMDLQTPGDLKLGEVLDLLKDYRRLANALKSMGAFEEK
ncbi:vacuolar sorting protein 9 (VPS9) domain-containing protein [Sarocladium implicatum]|nr:vacuolar sorting protein 9 (VPS9) domain-containing protein [Sarocladium implicatum]